MRIPLLQYTLTQLFDRQVSGLLTAAAYDELGGVAGSIAGRAEELFGELTPDQQVAARRLFGRLVTLGEGVERHPPPGRARRAGRRPGDTAGDRPLRTRPAARLRPRSSVAGAHRRGRPRGADTWVASAARLARRRPRRPARAPPPHPRRQAAWDERDRDPAELYRGARLVGAEPLLTRRETVTLTPAESAFLTASVEQRNAEADAERRRVQRLRRLVAATAVVAVFMLVAGVAALWQWGRADDQAARAEASAQEALDNATEAARNAADAEANAAAADENADAADANAALAERRAAQAEASQIEAEAAQLEADLERMRAVALANASEDPTVSALLAVEAYRLDPSFDGLDTLHRVLTEIPGFHGTIGSGAYIDSVLLDDRTLAAATDTEIEIWDVADQELLGSIDHATTVGRTVIAPAGEQRVAALDASRTATTIYDVADGAAVATFQHRSGVNDIGVSPDGGSVAAALGSGAVEIWSLADETLVATIEADPAGVSFIAWHPDGRRVAAATLSGRLQLWDTTTAELVWATEPPVEAGIVNQLRPYLLSISPGGERVAALLGSVNGQMHTIDVATGQPVSPSFNAVSPDSPPTTPSGPTSTRSWPRGGTQPSGSTSRPVAPRRSWTSTADRSGRDVRPGGRPVRGRRRRAHRAVGHRRIGAPASGRDVSARPTSPSSSPAAAGASSRRSWPTARRCSSRSSTCRIHSRCTDTTCRPIRRRGRSPTTSRERW